MLNTHVIQSKAFVQRRPRWEKKETKMAGKQDRPRDDIQTIRPLNAPLDQVLM